MKESQLRVFEEAGILASAMTTDGKVAVDLDVDRNGFLSVPAGFQPKSFHLIIATDRSKTFLAQKNVANEGGGYSRQTLSKLEGFPRGFKAEVVSGAILVERRGRNVWTSWHAAKPNRVDCWMLDRNGNMGLFQVGVFTHDDGRTWKLHGEWRWKGKLFQMANGAMVGKPEHQKYGSLEGGTSARTQIFNHPDFQTLLRGVRLAKWKGSDEDLYPKLPSVPGHNQAVVQWYITFAGQTGQGPVNVFDPQPDHYYWVHGLDIEGVEPDPDGEIRLWQGDIISYSKLVSFGTKPKSFKPLNARLVSRGW